ncbi:MAG: hypothetical protein PVH88_00450 [Ignavibacteria bacterium]|jgi:hypothetical protein
MIKSRIHRTVKKLKRFDTNIESSKTKIILLDNEECFGVYKNDYPDENYLIYITNYGLRISIKDDFNFIRYSDIKSTKTSSDKLNDLYITLELKSNSKFKLLINGQDGKFRDKFEFHRFLDRAIHDINDNDK